MSKKDWKKTWLRMKQMADQNLGRAEKSKVLNGDMQSLERRLDQIKLIYQATGQKLIACLPPPSSSVEKRLRKLPDASLGRCFKDSFTELGTHDTLGKTYMLCAEIQAQLAKEILSYTQDVEQQVVQPIQAVLENEIPAICKLRKQLTKLTLDMDSAKGRHQSAMKQSTKDPSKVDSAREEMEQAESKVNLCRDQLATEMYAFFAQEGQISDTLLRLVNAQKNLHSRSLDILQTCIPRIEQHIRESISRPVYGCPLEQHLNSSGRKIATVIEKCVRTLLRNGINEEGLFRVTSSSSRVKKLKAAFDANMVDMEEYENDVHCIAGALKMYLRELPEPLMTYDLYKEWIHIVDLPNEMRQNSLWVVVDKMPKANYNNLSYLIKFLAKLAQNSKQNKMTPSNIAIVIGPSLLWAAGSDGPTILSASNHSAVIEWLITKSEWFFPGELDFGIDDLKSKLQQQHIDISRRRSYSPCNGTVPRQLSHSVRDLLSSTSDSSPSNSSTSIRVSSGVSPRVLFFQGKTPWSSSNINTNSTGFARPMTASMGRNNSWCSYNTNSLTDTSSLSGSNNSLLDGEPESPGTDCSRSTTPGAIFTGGLTASPGQKRAANHVRTRSPLAQDYGVTQTTGKSHAANTTSKRVQDGSAYGEPGIDYGLPPDQKFSRIVNANGHQQNTMHQQRCNSSTELGNGNGRKVSSIAQEEKDKHFQNTNSNETCTSLPMVTVSSPLGSSINDYYLMTDFRKEQEDEQNKVSSPSDSESGTLPPWSSWSATGAESDSLFSMRFDGTPSIMSLSAFDDGNCDAGSVARYNNSAVDLKCSNTQRSSSVPLDAPLFDRTTLVDASVIDDTVKPLSIQSCPGTDGCRDELNCDASGAVGEASSKPDRSSIFSGYSEDNPDALLHREQVALPSNAVIDSALTRSAAVSPVLPDTSEIFTAERSSAHTHCNGNTRVPSACISVLELSSTAAIQPSIRSSIVTIDHSSVVPSQADTSAIKLDAIQVGELTKPVDVSSSIMAANVSLDQDGVPEKQLDNFCSLQRTLQAPVLEIIHALQVTSDIKPLEAMQAETWQPQWDGTVRLHTYDARENNHSGFTEILQQPDVNTLPHNFEGDVSDSSALIHATVHGLAIPQRPQADTHEPGVDAASSHTSPELLM